MALKTIIGAVLPEIGGASITIGLLINIGLVVYIFIAMQRFYKQKAIKTILKWFLLVSTMTVVISIIQLCFVLNSFFAMESGH